MNFLKTAQTCIKFSKKNLLLCCFSHIILAQYHFIYLIGMRCARRETLRNEKALGETQTLRAGCNKAEQKNFRPSADPLPVDADGQNLIS